MGRLIYEFNPIHPSPFNFSDFGVKQTVKQTKKSIAERYATRAFISQSYFLLVFQYNVRQPKGLGGDSELFCDVPIPV